MRAHLAFGLICGMAALTTAVAKDRAAIGTQGERSSLVQRVTALGRDTPWTLVNTVRVSFRTFHPQGMVRIGDTFLVSSVEVRVPPKRLAQRTDGGRYDRDTGEGVGHLFQIGPDGEQLADLLLGEGSIYHPGGIDFDGTHVWVPVAEYRPNGRSIVYRVDPKTMTARKVFTFDDHLGGIVHDKATRTLHGVSWGSRRFYRWTLDDQGRVTNAGEAPERLRRLNPSHYVDYQDCQSVAPERMLCTGVADLRRPSAVAASGSAGSGGSGGPSSIRLGGVELVDLKEGRPIHQTPLPLWTAGGVPITQNPAWFEVGASGGVRGYFMPEDDSSTIYIYDAPAR